MAHRCDRTSPSDRPCVLNRNHKGDHEAWHLGGRVVERWPRRPEGKPPKPARALRLAADGTPEIKVSGIPLDVLEEMEGYAARHRLEVRGRNALIARCALAGWSALLKQEKGDARRGRSA